MGRWATVDTVGQGVTVRDTAQAVGMGGVMAAVVDTAAAVAAAVRDGTTRMGEARLL